MTGLIGLAIIAIWLVVLVPMWLGRHEADEASRSMDTFSTAMKVLSRRTGGGGRDNKLGVTVDNYPGAKVTARHPPRVSGAAGRARLMARRRRVAAVVAMLTVVLALTAALGITSWWYELAIGLAAAGYVIHLRNEAIRDRELRRRRLARASRAVAAWDSHEAPAARRPAHSLSEREPMMTDDDVLPPAPVSAAGTENGSRWEPVPVPLPTYVSKPVVARAAGAVRADVDASGTIDLTRPGEWSETIGASGVVGASDGGWAAGDGEIDHRHLLLDETGSGRVSASPGAPSASGTRRGAGVSPSEIEDDELDLILERRRAVGD